MVWWCIDFVSCVAVASECMAVSCKTVKCSVLSCFVRCECVIVFRASKSSKIFASFRNGGETHGHDRGGEYGLEFFMCTVQVARDELQK